MPSAQRVFFPFLAERFPDLLKRYERSYAEGAYLSGKYPERIRKMVAGIRERVGIPSRDAARLEIVQRAAVQEPQLALF